tara:strand:+ start:285 stop:734 length:450 start_codon:yes stop_codon:yes gene_type:complete
MGLLIPWRWDSESTYSSSFLIETSLTDFDEPYSPKNVYGLQLSTITGNTSHATFDVFYRKSKEDSYTFWGSHTNDSNTNPDGIIMNYKGNSTRDSNIYNQAEPIKDVITFQIKITAVGYGEFAVNDINILFRSKRKWTATDVKTYIRAT